MRKTLVIIFVALAAVLTAKAQEHLSERVYISTDRDVYVAGDEMYLSAFCFDMFTGRFSNTSRTVYLEVVSPEGPVQTAKLALDGGRGGGVVSLLNTIPTGEYRLVAYTAQCFNEDGYDFLEGARTISIINPFTATRSSSGVEILSDEDYASLESAEIPYAGSVRLASDGPLTLTNASDRPVTLSVSVFHDDGLVSPSTSSPAAFLAGATRGSSFTDRRTIDYEGEIVRTHLVVTDGDMSGVAGTSAFLSVPGRGSDVYCAEIGDDGSAVFYTRNIRGDVDMVLEADSSSSAECHLEIDQPFAGVSDPDIPKLPLSVGLEDRILQRSLAMQIGRAARIDTLYVRPEVPSDIIFAADSVEYILDDYTRFPLMEELFIEFIGEVRTQRTRNGRGLVVNLRDTYRLTGANQVSSLLLLDGVPLPNQNTIFDYDPLLVERIVVYPHTTYFAGRPYAGVVSFSTYRHDLPSYQFADNSRIVRFQGVSDPVIACLPVESPDVPDLRQTVLWHPLVEIGPGESISMEYCLPSYDGSFKVVVQGFDDAGNPQYVSAPLSVR